DLGNSSDPNCDITTSESVVACGGGRTRYRRHRRGRIESAGRSGNIITSIAVVKGTQENARNISEDGEAQHSSGRTAKLRNDVPHGA
ncbi:hypothetical protein PIB30_077526, partial [Stylosanthes scabra]|nr:hypothetical protein [Stylosanthes scabra]